MVRIAAAIAADGTMRDARIDPGATPASHEFLPPDAARLLGGFMRDVVLSGTGRSLRDAPVPIAGKTGTAEIAGAPSHAWFVGFAPYGPAKKRIAVAVVLENAGNGGTPAAPVPGENRRPAAARGAAARALAVRRVPGGGRGGGDRVRLESRCGVGEPGIRRGIWPRARGRRPRADRVTCPAVEADRRGRQGSPAHSGLQRRP